MKTITKTIITTLALLAVFTLGASVEALQYQGRLIKIGTVGPDVKEVQQCLLDMGFDLPVYGADGYYGQETYVQITSYQIANNLLVDGIVGPQTAGALTCEEEEELTETQNDETSEESEEEMDSDEEDQKDNEDDEEQNNTVPAKTTDNVDTDAQVISNDGDDNDTAEFSYEFDLRSFGNRSFVSENAADSVNFSVVDSSTGTTVFNTDGSVQEGSVVVSISGNSDIENSFYRIDEDEYESFEVIISYNPYAGTPAGSGSYRVQLDGITYKIGSTSSADTTYNTSSLTKFRTKSVNVVN